MYKQLPVSRGDGRRGFGMPEPLGPKRRFRPLFPLPGIFFSLLPVCPGTVARSACFLPSRRSQQHPNKKPWRRSETSAPVYIQKGGGNATVCSTPPPHNVPFFDVVSPPREHVYGFVASRGRRAESASPDRGREKKGAKAYAAGARRPPRTTPGRWLMQRMLTEEEKKTHPVSEAKHASSHLDITTSRNVQAAPAAGERRGRGGEARFSFIPCRRR